MNDRVHQLNHDLMQEMRAQGARHAAEIKSLATKVEENTEAVRKCMMDLVQFNAERSNLTKCLIDMRETLDSLKSENVETKVQFAKLETRWVMVKIFVTINLGILGAIAAWVKLS